MTTTVKILKQGDSYPFKIYKRLKLPGDEQDLFILIGPGEKKYLLKTTYYEHYNLRIGQEIICKVDKINCSGQIFLEPEHPYYAIGKKYEFSVKDIKTDLDPWGNLQYIVSVLDINGRPNQCLIKNTNQAYPGNGKIECLVSNIRKGKLFLTFEDNQNNLCSLKVGELSNFIIAGNKEYNGKDYYVLTDQSGFKHLLLKEYYLHFNYAPGQEIRASVLDKLPDQSYRIEPVNPSYIIGAVYEFKVIKSELISNELGDLNGVFYIEDKFGQITPVSAKEWQVNRPLSKPGKIRCRVVRYKKGKLQLENMEELS